jgi:MFS family permease
MSRHAPDHEFSDTASKDEKVEIEVSSQIDQPQDTKFERRVLRKIDVRLLPILGALYTISLVDRSNISVARISGLDEDVDLDVGNRASVALMVFFIGYVIFELPSNMIIHRVGPANWLSFICFAWGLVSIGIGFLHNWVGLAICRAMLGVLEAGFFPGYVPPVVPNRRAPADTSASCIYLVSSWYRRYEVQKRLAGFFLTASALSAFANILAYGLIQIGNHTNYKGWR